MTSSVRNGSQKDRIIYSVFLIPEKKVQFVTHHITLQGSPGCYREFHNKKN